MSKFFFNNGLVNKFHTFFEKYDVNGLVVRPSNLALICKKISNANCRSLSDLHALYPARKYLHFPRKNMNSQIVSVRFRGKRRDHNFESISLIILVTGLSAIIYQYAFNVKQKMSTWLSSNLSVNATTVLDDFQASKNFNFIADAVEKAAPSVVYIEKIERLSSKDICILILVDFCVIFTIYYVIT